MIQIGFWVQSNLIMRKGSITRWWQKPEFLKGRGGQAIWLWLDNAILLLQHITAENRSHSRFTEVVQIHTVITCEPSHWISSYLSLDSDITWQFIFYLLPSNYLPQTQIQKCIYKHSWQDFSWKNAVKFWFFTWILKIQISMIILLTEFCRLLCMQVLSQVVTYIAS